jgi:hypothetical protein
MTAPVIAVFGASHAHPGDGLYEQGVLCGGMLGEAGFAVVTGGYGGLMEAVSRGAAEAGARVIGVTVPAVFTDRAGANRFVAEEMPTPHLVERIHEMTNTAAGAIVLPGSLGTLTELAVAWNLAFVARFSGADPKPLITVGSTWSELVATLGSILHTDTALVTCVSGVPEAVAEIVRLVPTDD